MWQGEGETGMGKATKRRKRGQSLVETAILFPVLLIIFSGVLEFGLMLTQILALQDGARNAARFASDSLYYQRDTDQTCSTTRDFYRQAGCLVNQELRQDHPLVELNDNGTPNDTSDDFLDPTRGDDIIVSVFTVTQGTGVTGRFPGEDGEDGWSYAEDIPSYGTRNMSSDYSTADIDNDINTAAPSTGFVLVEVFYHYEHFFGLPWITAVVPDPLVLRSSALMPNVSAEPTPTPLP
jgi:hypothetical protein